MLGLLCVMCCALYVVQRVEGYVCELSELGCELRCVKGRRWGTHRGRRRSILDIYSRIQFVRQPTCTYTVGHRNKRRRTETENTVGSCLQ